MKTFTQMTTEAQCQPLEQDNNIYFLYLGFLNELIIGSHGKTLLGSLVMFFFLVIKKRKFRLTEDSQKICCDIQTFMGFVLESWQIKDKLHQASPGKGQSLCKMTGC